MALIKDVLLLPSTLMYAGTYGKNREKIQPEFPHQVGNHFYNAPTGIDFFFTESEKSASSEGEYLTGFPLKPTQLEDLINNLNIT